MKNLPMLTAEPGLPSILAETLEAAEGYALRSKADNTRRAYRSAWKGFAAWCGANGMAALPALPSTVGLHLAAQARAGRKFATLNLYLAAIVSAHSLKGHALDTRHPTIRDTMSGIARSHGTAQRGKAAILKADLRSMLDALPETISGLRDRALILVGFASALRRSELVGLDLGDAPNGGTGRADFTPEGITITLNRSKTDQEGAGAKIGVPYASNPTACPVRALKAWLAAAMITGGPIFRPVDRAGRVLNARLSDRSVALIVKRAISAAGLDAAKFAGHSLRSGLATSAAIAGASERSIMNQTRHKSVGMVRRYIRDGDLYRDNAASAALSDV